MTSMIVGHAPQVGAWGLQAATPGGFRQTILTVAAKALGMPEYKLQTELRGGKSIADVATEQGVSRDSLVAAVTEGIQSLAPNGLAGANDAANFAQRIVDRQGLAAPQRSPGGPAVVGSSRLATLAHVLGVKRADIYHALRVGMSVPDQLRENGIATDALDAYDGRDFPAAA
jgi:lambda repressor-like predicted transcriptional regulator